VALRGNFAANNSEALRELALAGVGIALAPSQSGRTATTFHGQFARMCTS
jgi:DNA-binding transcriptional LysR family regulator